MIDIAPIEKAIAKQEKANPYEYVLWCNDVSAKLSDLATDYANKSKQELDRITRDKIESEQWEVVIPVESSQAVNVEKLREEQPKTFKKIVHLKATDAVKLIGENKIYKMAAKAENYKPSMDVITLADLKKELGSKAKDYISTVFKPQSRMIVPKGSYHDPRELPEAEA